MWTWFQPWPDYFQIIDGKIDVIVFKPQDSKNYLISCAISGEVGELGHTFATNLPDALDKGEKLLDKHWDHSILENE